MKRHIQRLLGVTAISLATFGFSSLSTPANAAPTCVTYSDGQNIYPAQNQPSNFAICLTGTVDPNRRDAIVNAVKQLPHKVLPTDQAQPRDSLQTANVSYLYFDDRASANAWFQAKNYPSIFQDSSGRCGNTVGSPTGIITSVIYDKCTFAGNVQISNPNLRRTTLHETGHAFAIAIAKNTGLANILNGPDVSPGWKQIVKEDIPKLTPPQWFNVWNQPQRENYLCAAVFQTIPPSALELDLGATPDSVCSGNPAVPIDGNGQRTPTEIAELKLPYFVAVDLLGNPTSNKELWAELFLIRADTSAPAQTNFLKLTDQVLGYGNGWTDTTANFHCAKVVMQYFYTTLKPPSSQVLSAQTCNANPGSFGSN